jgi:hypothetical protein
VYRAEDTRMVRGHAMLVGHFGLLLAAAAGRRSIIAWS